MKWAYGVTTVPERRHTLLPGTLRSLAAAGFAKPRLFIDGAKNTEPWAEFGLEVTTRWPLVRTAYNWILALWELWARHGGEAERFVIFQDDLLAVKNLRQYLETVPMPERGYWSLHTCQSNQGLAGGRIGFYPSHQLGRSAVGLCFSRDGVMRLLSSIPHIIDRPIDPLMGWRSIDGGVVSALKKQGWKEFVHNPSLLQHTGQITSMEKRKDVAEHRPDFPRVPSPGEYLASSFPGEDFDAMALCGRQGVVENKAELEDEVEALRQAIADDERRLLDPGLHPVRRVRTERYVREYRARLAEMEKSAAVLG